MKRTVLFFSVIGILLFAGCGQKSVETQNNTELQNEAGKTDPNLQVSIYDAQKAYNGTTLLTDGHDPSNFRVLEVNMRGEIVWEYSIPEELIKGQPVGFDAELLENGNILIVLSKSGIYEVNMDGDIVWSYKDENVSHDADRLANGNTLINFGNSDKKSDAQVKEVNQNGEVVWEWYANDAYGQSAFQDVKRAGWTHANGVQRLNDGNTLVSLRNFFLTIIVNANGEIVKEFDWSSFGANTDPHEPEMHETDNTLLTCLQNDSPYVAVEIDIDDEKPLWTYTNKHLRTARDCDQLPNGNVLITAVDNGGTKEDQSDDYSTIIEVTEDSEIVWRLDFVNVPAEKSPGWFFKAQRIKE